MDFNNQQLRDGIITKLKQYDAYIDNELPDYIIVMLANKKTILQIKNDLQLFLGSNTEQFASWLQNVVSSPERLDEVKELEEGEVSNNSKEEEIQAPEEVSEEVEDSSLSKPKVVTLPGSKTKRSASEIIDFHIQDSHSDSLLSGDIKEGVKSHSRSGRVKGESNREGQRSRLTLRKKIHKVQPDSTRDQDLREFIAQRREERNKHRHGDDRHDRYDYESDESEEEKEKVSTSLPSVVKMMKRPQHSDEGGSRLLRRALLGLGRVKTSRSDTSAAGSKVKIVTGRSSKEEVGVAGGVAKRVLRVKREQLDKILAPLKSPKKVSQVSSTDVQEDTAQGRGQDSEGAESGDESDPGDQVVIELEREDEEEDLLQEQIERATLAAVKSVLPMAARLGKRKSSDLPDLRELLANKASRTTDSPRFVVTLEGADNLFKTDPQENDMEGGTQEEEEETVRSGVPERCRFWPNCKNGDSCTYVHPSVPCKLFPKCKYGQKCLYVHPKCKFDARCTRAECPYLHTAPKHMSFKPAVVPVPSPLPMYKPKFNPTFSYSRSSPSTTGGGGQRFPNKAALTWTPNKNTHVSERTFAVPDNQTSSLPT